MNAPEFQAPARPVPTIDEKTAAAIAQASALRWGDSRYNPSLMVIQAVQAAYDMGVAAGREQ